MRTNPLELVITGNLGAITVDSSRMEIVEAFGEPEYREQQRKSYPEMLVFGTLEFRLRDGKLTGLALACEPSQMMERSDLIAELKKAGLRWVSDPTVQEGNEPQLQVSNGIWLAFSNGRLSRVVLDRSIPFPMPGAGLPEES